MRMSETKKPYQPEASSLWNVLIMHSGHLKTLGQTAHALRETAPTPWDCLMGKPPKLAVSTGLAFQKRTQVPSRRTHPRPASPRFFFRHLQKEHTRDLTISCNSSSGAPVTCWPTVTEAVGLVSWDTPGTPTTTSHRPNSARHESASRKRPLANKQHSTARCSN